MVILTESQNQGNAYPQDKNTQAMDFSHLFFEFTTKMDVSSSKIVDFYSSFVEQKLQLAAQHIDQIANLKHLQPAPLRAPIVQVVVASERKSMKRRFRSSQKKIVQPSSGFRISDLSKDLLRLDLEFMEPISLPPSAEPAFSSREDTQRHSSTIPQSLVQHEYTHQMRREDQQPIPLARKSKVSYPKAMQNEGSDNKENWQSNRLEVPSDPFESKEGFRKSLMNQFSEIKIKPLTELQIEQQQIQAQIDQIELDSIRQSCLTEEASVQQKSENQKPESYEESLQEDEMLFRQIGCTSDGQEGTTEDTDQQDQWEEYEMTDYSSNESSNLGSPVFAWVQKELPVPQQKKSTSDEYEVLGFLKQPLKQKPLNIFESNHLMAAAERESMSQSTMGFGNSSQTAVSSQQSAYSPFFTRDSLMMKSTSNNMGIKKEISFFPAAAAENSQRLQNQNESQQSFYEHKKLLQSPQKLKTVKQRKILYCNNKEVPSWAYDLKSVTEKARQQNITGPKPEDIFGSFTVENLNLQDVFKDTGKRYEEGRGSSANWRQDYTPEQIENLINATSHTPNRKKQSKFTSFLQNSFNSIKNIKKKLL